MEQPKDYPMEPGEEFGEVTYNGEPGDEVKKNTDPTDSGEWFEDY